MLVTEKRVFSVTSYFYIVHYIYSQQISGIFFGTVNVKTGKKKSFSGCMVDVGTYEFKGLCIFPKLLGLGILAGYLSC